MRSSVMPAPRHAPARESRKPQPALSLDREAAIERLNEQVRTVHAYWLRNFGEMPTGEECATIVAVIDALGGL